MGRRGPVLAVALAVVILCAGCAGQATGRSASGRPDSSPAGGKNPGPAWIITAGSLPRLAAAGLAVPELDADFDNPGTLVLDRGYVDGFVPDASPAMVFTSETSLAGALSGGQVPPAVTWVVLDLEHWPLTPSGEQADPVGAVRGQPPMITSSAATSRAWTRVRIRFSLSAMIRRNSGCGFPPSAGHWA